MRTLSDELSRPARAAASVGFHRRTYQLDGTDSGETDSDESDSDESDSDGTDSDESDSDGTDRLG